MLARLLRLRRCRILALLAALLVAGVLPHAHAEAAMMAGVEQGMAAQDETPAPEKAAPAHCGLCHAARAMLPWPEAAGAPCAMPGEALVPALGAAPEGLPGGVPARPPRGVAIL